MAKKMSKKKMILAGKSFDEIKKLYKSTDEKEIAYLAYMLQEQTGKQIIVPGLVATDCYVNNKGSITIGEAVVADTNFGPGAAFQVSYDDTQIILTYDKEVELPPKKVKKEVKDITE